MSNVSSIDDFPPPISSTQNSSSASSALPPPKNAWGTTPKPANSPVSQQLPTENNLEPKKADLVQQTTPSQPQNPSQTPQSVLISKKN